MVRAPVGLLAASVPPKPRQTDRAHTLPKMRKVSVFLPSKRFVTVSGLFQKPPSALPGIRAPAKAAGKLTKEKSLAVSRRRPLSSFTAHFIAFEVLSPFPSRWPSHPGATPETLRFEVVRLSARRSRRSARARSDGNKVGRPPRLKRVPRATADHPVVLRARRRAPFCCHRSNIAISIVMPPLLSAPL